MKNINKISYLILCFLTIFIILNQFSFSTSQEIKEKSITELLHSKGLGVIEVNKQVEEELIKRGKQVWWA
jgi:hypothetical protein